MKPKVFISYRRTSAGIQRISEFAAWLEEKGFAPVFDERSDPRDRDWAAWAKREVNNVDWVFAICDEEYSEVWNKVEGLSESQWTEDDNRGKGAGYEILIIRNILCRSPGSLGKVRFIVFGDPDRKFIPQEYDTFPSFNFQSDAGKAHIESLLTASRGEPASSVASGDGDFSRETDLSASPASSGEGQATSLDKWTVHGTKPDDWEKNEYAQEILNEIKQLRKHTQREATRKAKQNIMNIMGTLTERFGATSSWLFLKVSDAPDLWIEQFDWLSLEYFHNTGITSLRFKATEIDNGIVGHVAFTRRPYLSNDVTRDPFYFPSVDDTKCELAVPIFFGVDSAGEPRLIGIFNLESSEPEAFLEAHPGELMAAATQLAPEILILNHLKRRPERDPFGWHPQTMGWTLERLLDDFCSAVSARMKPATGQQKDMSLNKLTRPSCTVWYLDRKQEQKEERLYVRGTARFDYEYINQRALDDTSFSWAVAALGRGMVAHGEPRLLPFFQRRKKSKKMGMIYAFATPIYLPNDSVGRSVGTLNLYFFWEELRKQVNRKIAALPERVPPWLIVELANTLGELIQDTQRLRRDVSAAYLRYRLHESALPDHTDFETIKDAILRCLDADCCSVFGRVPGGERGTLRCLATTGLRRFDGTAVDLTEIVYDLDNPNEQGVAAYLANQSKRCLRCRSIVDSNFRDGEQQVRPVNKYRETYSHTDTEHRPFLGVSVDDPIDANQPPSGIIRVLRRTGSKPFLLSDETLLRRITDDSHFHFHRWKQTRRWRDHQEQPAVWGAKYPFLIRVVGPASAQAKLKAIDHIASEFAAGTVWNRPQVDAVLLDVINIFRSLDRKSGKQGGLIANFRLKHRAVAERLKSTTAADSSKQNAADPTSQLRIFAIHAPLSSDPPPEGYLTAHEEANQSIGLITIQKKQVITFDAEEGSPTRCPFFRPILNESKLVRSGACIPVRFLSTRGPIWGVLSLDCDDLHFTDWRSEHLQVLSLAAKKLDFVGRDNCLRDEQLYSGRDWQEGMQMFLAELSKTMRLDACNLTDRKTKKSFFTLPPGKEKVLEQAIGDLNQRIECIADWNERGGFKLHLPFGAFDTGLTLTGCLQGVPVKNDRNLLHEWIATKIVDINHLWNRFANARIGDGMTPLISVAFSLESQQQMQGMHLWKEKIDIAPEVFGRDQVQGR